jgi:hypothetical protein
MPAHKQSRQNIGQILLDGGFLSSTDLEMALAEQQHTNELLGQILVRMGVVDPVEIKAALSVQEHIGNPEEAIRSAAGTRQMLGSLLIMAGRISHEQLEHAIAVQKISGEKLGEVFIRLGILKEEQLNNLLAYQQNQSSETPTSNPFRLGEILVTTGYITRKQLNEALLKQATTSKNLGEVLIEDGYAAAHHVKHGVRLQQRLVTAALAAILAFSELSLSGCGGGGGGGGGETANTTPVTTQYSSDQAAKTAYLTVTSDDYTLAAPNFYYSTINESFWSIQANIARYVQDIDTRCVIRIDVPKINGSWPLLNKKFSIEDNAQYEKFPGTILVFNGSPSTMSKVEHGIISFAPDSITSEHVSGYFEVTMTDYGSDSLPVPHHHLKGDFNFKMGEFRRAETL